MSAQSLKILLVDDARDQYTFVRDLIVGLGEPNFSLDWSSNYAAGLEQIERREHDVCLVDYRLGQRDGLELIKEARAKGCQTPLILLTGDGNRELIKEALQAGAADYLEKTDLKPSALDRSIRYALEHKRLEAVEHHERIMAEVLLDTAIANSTLEFEAILDRILTNIGQLIPSDLGNIMLIEAGVARVASVKNWGKIAQTVTDMLPNIHITVADTPDLFRMFQSGQPTVIPDVNEDPNWVVYPEFKRVRSFAGIPIQLHGAVVGFLNLYSARPNAFQPSIISILSAFSKQIAIAMGNLTAREQANQLAMLEERQRLARDLHDSVSQTLFSARIISEMTLRQADIPVDLRTQLSELHFLNQRAWAEMRSLLTELRPQAITDSDIEDLLRQLVEATATPTSPVSLQISGKCTLSAEAKIVLYRVAQQALRNVTQHAQAAHVVVSLTCQPSGTELSVQDNGRGFDPLHIPPDHFGVGIMKERAKSVGAAFNVTSQPGAGSTILLTIPA